VTPTPDDLIALLVCPESRAPLIHFPGGTPGAGDAEFLLCPASRLRYRIEDGLPIMLIEEAERLAAGEVERLVAIAKQRGLRVPS
jgi:uncharacterized protein